MKAIVNIDENWGIGQNNKLLFSLKGDMQFFRQTTQNQLVILGRKTLESFPEGKPLKNRVHVVLSSSEEPFPEGVIVCSHITELHGILAEYRQLEHFVIGGDCVYRQLIDYCDSAYVTKVFAVQQADRFFPNLDQKSQWKLQQEEPPQTENGITYQILRYVQNKESVKPLV